MITNIRIDWMENYANDPRIIIESDKPVDYPAKDMPVWIRYASGIHVAQMPGSDFVHYFYSDGKPCQGFGGATFEGRFKNTGDTFKYRGAWSSRAACVNAEMLDGYQIVDVSCGYHSTAIRAYTLVNAWRKMKNPGFGFVWVDNDDKAPILMPIKPLEPVKNSEQNRILRFVHP